MTSFSALVGRTLLAAGVLLVLLAGPAAADAPRNTNYRSRVVGLQPPTAGVSIDVVGGDSFLHLHVAGGHTVIVHGYDGEPYLRVGVDGTVDENMRSPAVLLNTARYGTTAPQPAEVDPKAEPRWVKVASGGDYAWHDHRSHWMGSAKPPQLGSATSGKVFDWTVPLEVDGKAVTVAGTLALDTGPSALPWIAIAVAGGVVIFLLARLGPTVVVLSVFLVLAAVLTGVLSAKGQLALPAAVGRRPSLYLLPVIAGVCGLVAIVARHTRYAVALVAGAALTLPLWIFSNLGVLSHAVPVTDVSPGLQRASVALAGAATLACLLVAVQYEAREIVRIDDDDEDDEDDEDDVDAPEPDRAR